MSREEDLMYTISYCVTPPQLDTMPVIKTIYHPLANGTGYRPLAYSRCAYVEGHGMLIDLQAFERKPSDCGLTPPHGSCIAAAFCFGGAVLCAVANAAGRCSIYLDGELQSTITLQTHCYSGEDEQGWYWGVRFYLANEVLATASMTQLAVGSIIKADFYKFRLDAERAYIASVCPMAADVDLLCPTEALADFTLVAY